MTIIIFGCTCVGCVNVSRDYTLSVKLHNGVLWTRPVGNTAAEDRTTTGLRDRQQGLHVQVWSSQLGKGSTFRRGPDPGSSVVTPDSFRILSYFSNTVTLYVTDYSVWTKPPSTFPPSSSSRVLVDEPLRCLQHLIYTSFVLIT